MTNPRGAARARRYLPAPPFDDLDALDRLVVCDLCRRPYRVVGKFEERRVVPDHEPWCRWHRPPNPSTIAGGPASPVQAPGVPEVHQEATRTPRTTAGGAL